jgi:hypothetical protein
LLLAAVAVCAACGLIYELVLLTLSASLAGGGITQTSLIVAGYVAALAYLRYRNLFVLGVAHALLGTLLWLVVPDSVSHHLVVGPGMSAHDRAGMRHQLHQPPGERHGAPRGARGTRA